MHASRVAVVVTCLVVAGLCVWFAWVGWDQANRVATVVSALAAVVSVGVAVWTALRGSAPGGSVRVSGTGKATASRGGSANTGFRGRGHAGLGSVRVENTGDADASGGGEANTGVRWD